MAFDWGTDVSQPVEDAIARLPLYNSGNYNVSTNPRGLAGGGHPINFPAALTDTQVVANGFKTFADLMSGYATAAAASAVNAAAATANLSGTSTSSVTLSTGIKSFATQSGKTWPAGTYLLASSDASPTTHWMVLLVTAYTGSSLSATAVLFSGSGSRSDWTIRATGVPGRFPGFPYLFSTNTSATPSDPTTGKLRLNAAPGAATALFISETDLEGNALGPLILTWGTSTSVIKGRIYIQSITQPTNFVILNITSSVTDSGAYDTVAVTVAHTGGTLTDGAQVSVVAIPYGNAGDTGPQGIQGIQGATGLTGATGDDAGLEYVFNSTTSGDPGTGKFLFNNATFVGAANQWSVSETDNNANSVGGLLAALDDGTGTNKILVFAIKQGGSAYFSFYVTSTLTDAGAYNTFPITPIATSGSIANGDTFHIITIPLTKGDTGTTGAAGPTTAPVWTFDSDSNAVASDPGANEFRFNAGTAAAATTLFINEQGPGANDMSAWILTWDDSTNSGHRGTLFLIQTNDPTKYATFTTGTVTDLTTYDSVALTHVAGPGGFTNGQPVAFQFTRTGNAGAGAGDVVGPASATNNGIALFDGGTGKLIKSSAAVGALAYLASVGTTEITNNAVTLAKLATQAASTVLANTTGGAAVPTAADITTTFKTALALTKTDVGLANVDNTSDANKPVSTATAAALGIKSVVRVRAATTTPITVSTGLNNGDTLDGVTLVTGDNVLLAGQSAAGENGIYTVAVSPARHTSFAAYNDHPGTLVIVQEGSVNADSEWVCTSDNGGTIGVTGLTFVRYGGASGAQGRVALAATDQTALQTAVGVTIGVNTQAFDALLTSIAGQAMIADRYLYGTGVDTVTLGTITVAGRDMLAAANAAAQTALLSASSTTASGIVELATDAETQTGSDTARAVTPSNITAKEATTAQYLANTADRILTTDQVNAAGALFALTDGATVNWDMASGFNASWTIAGNRTLANPTNTIVGRTGALVITTSGANRTITFGTSWEAAGGSFPVPSTTTATKDILFYWIQSATSIVITGYMKAVA